MRLITRTRQGIALWGLLIAGCATHTSVQTPSTQPLAQPVLPAVAEPVAGVTAAQPVAEPAPAAPAPAVPTDVWERIRAGFRLPALNNQYVEYFEHWNQSRPEYLARISSRARPYLHYIVAEVERRGMPSEIALLPAIESAFKPTAYSRAHAAGLWQFIPSTGRRYGLKQNWWYDGRRDVVRATNAALDYLQALHTEFNGDWFLALAAYNAGERKIHRAIAYNRKRGRPTNYSSLRLKSETRRYVPKLIAFKNVVSNPARYGLRLNAIPNEPYFAEVNVDFQVDLGVVGKLAGVSQSHLRELNPAFRRWATDPNGPHGVLIPVQHAARLERNLALLPGSERMRWTHHRIRRGETLSTIARRYRVTVNALKTTNKLRSSRIRANRDLLIPVSARKYTETRPAPRHARATASGRSVNTIIHRVRSGDTLWDIAQRYGVYVKQLARWNTMRVNDVLRLDQKLLIYRN